MGKFWKKVKRAVNKVGKAVGSVIKGVGNVLKQINNKIIKPAAKIVGDTIKNALKDPIGTIAKIATAVYAPYLLPYVNAASVLAQGGSFEDAFKAGALTFVGQQAFASLELGSETLADGQFGPPAPVSVNSLSSDLGKWVADSSSVLGQTGSNILANAAVQGTLGAVKGGLMAAIQGKNIGDGMAEGATSGAVSGGFNSAFSSAAKNLGIDPKSTTAATTALAGKAVIALASGEDPNQMLANYLAYTVNSKGADFIAEKSKDAYDAFSEYAKDFSEKNSKYEDNLFVYKRDRQELLDENDSLQKEVKEKWNPIQEKLDDIIDAQDTIKSEFDKQEAIYNDKSKSVDVRNAAGAKMEKLAGDYEKKQGEYTKLYDANKDVYTGLINKRDDIVSRIETLDKTAGSDLTKTRTELENGVKTLADYKDKSDTASKEYDTAIAEATTKNVLIDSVNNGVIQGELQDDGSILLDNGMTIKDGQFYQNGKNAFVSADPIEQGQIRFTDKNGKEVWFNNDRTQQVSTTDAQEILFNEYGIKADLVDVVDIVGQQSNALDPNSVRDVAEDKVNDQYNLLLDRDATPEEIESAFTPGQDTLENVVVNLADEILPTDQFFTGEDDKVAFAKQLAAVRADKGVGAEFTWVNPYTGEVETHRAFTQADLEGEEPSGGVRIDDSAFTSQWQTVGDKRVFIHDDGSASVIDPETGDTDSLDQDQVEQWVDLGLLNSWDSGYYDAIGLNGLSADEFAAQEDGGVGPTDEDYIDSSGRYMSGLTAEQFAEQEEDGGGPTMSDYEEAAGRYTGVFDGGLPRKAPVPMPGSPVMPDRPNGVLFTGVLPGQPGSGQPGVQPGIAQKGILPTGNPLEQDYLNIGLSKDKFVDPLSQLYQIQQATAQGGDGNLAQMMFQQFNPTGYQSSTDPTQPTMASGTGDSYYNYGENVDEQPYTGAIDPFSPSPYTPSPYAMGFESQALGAASGGAIMATPLMASGGKTLPLNVNGVLPTVVQGRENFKDGKHVAGKGDGQSDDIPAWLADGEFVFPADVVSALGNGSTKAGTDKLYEMMHSIREFARSAKPKDLPPPAKKSPLDYLKA